VLPLGVLNVPKKLADGPMNMTLLEKKALFNLNVEKYLFYRICIGFASKQC
jgi:hypothetical protein